MNYSIWQEKLVKIIDEAPARAGRRLAWPASRLRGGAGRAGLPRSAVAGKAF